MADQYFKDTARTTDSIEATGSMASSASPPGLTNKSVSSDASATAMAKFSLDLRDLEAAAALCSGQGSWDSTANYRGLDAGNVHWLGGHVS